MKGMVLLMGECNYEWRRKKQYPWTMADVSAAWKACNQYYAESPIICRALYGHTIEEEHDWFELLYNIIGVWLIYHRRYREWNKEKSDDLAELLKFMQAYHMRIPRYLERTKFYRQKVK